MDLVVGARRITFSIVEAVVRVSLACFSPLVVAVAADRLVRPLPDAALLPPPPRPPLPRALLLFRRLVVGCGAVLVIGSLVAVVAAAVFVVAVAMDCFVLGR